MGTTIKTMALLAAIMLAAVPAAAQSETAEVAIRDNVFEPATLEVGGVAFVEWTHEGSVQHTVTADDGSFDSGVLNPGDVFRVELGAVERIPYHCTIHGGPGGEGMAGVLLDREGVARGAGDGRGDATDEPDDLAETGWADVPAAGLVLFALSLIALGAYLTQIERIVYPERS